MLNGGARPTTLEEYSRAAPRRLQKEEDAGYTLIRPRLRAEYGITPAVAIMPPLLLTFRCPAAIPASPPGT